MYVVNEILTCAGVISNTSASKLSAGNTMAAPNGDIRADTETRAIIHILIPSLNTEYGSSETRCWITSGVTLSSTSISLSVATSTLASEAEFLEAAIINASLSFAPARVKLQRLYLQVRRMGEVKYGASVSVIILARPATQSLRDAERRRGREGENQMVGHACWAT